MTRTMYLTAAVVVGLSSCVGTASANLIGSSVTGSIMFDGNPNNYFDPANGGVPAGFLNTASSTVTIGEPAVEFGYQDGANKDTANFTSNQLIVNDTVFSSAFNWKMTFTDTAFSSLGLTKISDTFTNGGVTGTLVGDTITLTWAGTGSADGLLVATFNAVPEPSSMILLGVGAVGLIAWAWRRRKRS